MKQSKGRQRSNSKSNKKHPADYRIILIQDGPLRTKASSEFQRALRKFEDAKAQLQRFEREDSPSHRRWMSATFGALLTEQRENSTQITEKSWLIDEVKMEMTWTRSRNPQLAYATVMKRRENPSSNCEDSNDDEAGENDFHDSQSCREDSDDDAFDEYQDDDEEDDLDDSSTLSMEEKIELFESFLKKVLGLNPKKLDPAKYEKMFAGFQHDFFGDDQSDVPGHQQANPKTEDARIKEIYRCLVRRLHPDIRADGDSQVAAIWHEVQEAYDGRNLNRLETLLALTEMQKGGTSGGFSLSQMRNAVAEMKQNLKAVQRSIREAKQDPAWGFSLLLDHTQIEKNTRAVLLKQIDQQRVILKEINDTLEQWSRPWVPVVKKSRVQQTKEHFNDPNQGEFSLF